LRQNSRFLRQSFRASIARRRSPSEQPADSSPPRAPGATLPERGGERGGASRGAAVVGRRRDGGRPGDARRAIGCLAGRAPDGVPAGSGDRLHGAHARGDAAGGSAGAVGTAARGVEPVRRRAESVSGSDRARTGASAGRGDVAGAGGAAAGIAGDRDPGDRAAVPFTCPGEERAGAGESGGDDSADAVSASHARWAAAAPAADLCSTVEDLHVGAGARGTDEGDRAQAGICRSRSPDGAAARMDGMFTEGSAKHADT